MPDKEIPKELLEQVEQMKEDCQEQTKIISEAFKREQKDVESLLKEEVKTITVVDCGVGSTLAQAVANGKTISLDSGDSEEPEYDNPNGSVWVVAINEQGELSIVQRPNIHCGFTDAGGYDPEMYGLDGEYDNVPAGLYRVVCDYNQSASDYEMPWIIDNFEFTIREWKTLHRVEKVECKFIDRTLMVFAKGTLDKVTESECKRYAKLLNVKSVFFDDLGGKSHEVGDIEIGNIAEHSLFWNDQVLDIYLNTGHVVEAPRNQYCARCGAAMFTSEAKTKCKGYEE